MYGVYSPCVKQYAFCQSGFAGVDVRRDSNVADVHECISFDSVRLGEGAEVSEAGQLLPPAETRWLITAGRSEGSIDVRYVNAPVYAALNCPRQKARCFHYDGGTS